MSETEAISEYSKSKHGKIEDERQRWAVLYRRVFKNEAGTVVLADILNMCRHAKMAETHDDMILQNLAKTILNRLSVHTDFNYIRHLDLELRQPERKIDQEMYEGYLRAATVLPIQKHIEERK